MFPPLIFVLRRLRADRNVRLARVGSASAGAFRLVRVGAGEDGEDLPAYLLVQPHSGSRLSIIHTRNEPKKQMTISSSTVPMRLPYCRKVYA